MNKNFYITTSIAYVNARPHIGYALELVQADILARYHREIGENVFFLTGTDDHGIKIERKAKELKIPINDFVRENIKAFKNLSKKLHISNDDFISTSDQKKHWPGATTLWRKLVEAGDIYKKKYEGFYCVGCEAFKKETDLVDGKCPDHGKAPEKIQEENYFFRLTKYTAKIKQLITDNKLAINPESKKNETLNILDNIEDVSFSRPKKKLSWGIPVPGDESQMMYVWCDALSNYISALGYGTKEDDKFRKFWPANIHVIGKDILKFHTIYWPAMLLSAGLKLPKEIFVHGHITADGQKMSKSLGNVIDPFEVIKKYGADALRYYLLREIPATGDGDFSAKKFDEVYNTELANELGNLVNRIIVMRKNFQLPIFNFQSITNFQFSNKMQRLIEKYKFNEAIKEIWEEIRKANQFIEENKPWELAKTDKEKLKEVMNELNKQLLTINNQLEIFLPDTAKKIQQQLETQKPEVLFPRIK